MNGLGIVDVSGNGSDTTHGLDRRHSITTLLLLSRKGWCKDQNINVSESTRSISAMREGDGIFPTNLSIQYGSSDNQLQRVAFRSEKLEDRNVVLLCKRKVRPGFRS